MVKKEPSTNYISYGKPVEEKNRFLKSLAEKKKKKKKLFHTSSTYAHSTNMDKIQDSPSLRALMDVCSKEKEDHSRTPEIGNIRTPTLGSMANLELPGTFSPMLSPESWAKQHPNPSIVKSEPLRPTKKVKQSHDIIKRKPAEPQSAGGSSCHQCKSRRLFNDLTYCTGNLDKKKKNCRKKYCEHCLKKFYKEDPVDIPDMKEWVCPSCRKLCSCAACRRRENKLLEGKNGSPNLKSMPPPLVPHGVDEDGMQHVRQGVYPYAKGHTASNEDCVRLLYQVVELPEVAKSISFILQRHDITDGQKIETIASLLRGVQKGKDNQNGTQS